MTKKTHIEATNSVVNNESDLRGVEILLNSPTSLLPPAEANVRETLKEFSAKLSQADAKHASDVELLKKRLEELAQQVTKPTAERKKSLLEMSAKGLKDAATAVGEIVPGLIATAEKVADAISRWLS